MKICKPPVGLNFPNIHYNQYDKLGDQILYKRIRYMNFNDYFSKLFNTGTGMARNMSEEPDSQMPPDLITETKDWRELFDPATVSKGTSDMMQRLVTDLRCNDYTCTGRVRSGSSHNFVKISRAPMSRKDSWKNSVFDCTCREARYDGHFCAHMAAVMYAWEKRHGPWTFTESIYEYERRKKEEERRRVIKRKEEMKKQYGTDPVPAAPYFDALPRMKGLVFHDLETAVAQCLTTPYALEREKVMQDALLPDSETFEETDGRDETSVFFSCNFKDEPEWVHVSGVLKGNKLTALESMNYRSAYSRSRNPAAFDPAAPLDEYQLHTLKLLWNHIVSSSSQDPTDYAAQAFFNAMDNFSAAAAEETLQESEAPAAKERVLTLLPRIIVENGKASLSFKMGRKGSRLYVLRNPGALAGAYLNEETDFALTKKEIIDFSQLDFCEESEPLMQFIARRVGEIQDVNKQLTSKSNYYYRVSTLSVTSSMDLEGSLLDGFYDIAEGGKCEYQDKTNGIPETTIPVGHRNLKIDLKADRLSDARGAFAGVEVSGLIPVMIKGSIANYILNDRGLTRISPEEKKVLVPFLKVADASGFFRFRVGRGSLQEFYYRVLPTLLDNPYVRLEDNLNGEQEQYLPPEPSFTFLIDFDEPRLICRAQVSYDGKVLQIPASRERDNAPGQYRDTVQEDRVISRIEKWFHSFDPEKWEYTKKVNSEKLYDFLTKGISDLEQMGTVKGTAMLARQKIRPMSSVRVGVSLESGIMDISVTSKEYTPDELLEILGSYRRKKRYHRLRSGDFVDLSTDGGLEEIEKLLGGLDLTPEEAIEKGVSLPMYRALYLNKLMEEHESVAASRDRQFRGLIKNFASIRDSDYEIPVSLEDTLRPYQAYGFKWLKTLEAAGFGGILADEMGLGKTLQMICVISSDKEAAASRPSLVVCPASLVYNWQEEFNRFAPSLSTLVLSGTLAARKTKLENYMDYDVCITSYDTLKRDILLYKDKYFQHCIVDEAQYIKNPKAAVSKAVKAISADHRFALTGTPIENRLSELWSIFDFLMPGFLYTLDEFTRRFELPIVSKKDEEAAARLRKMTGPFILRRCKQDVLADLPAKLEEVRYARLEGKQQQVYNAQVVRLKGMLAEPGAAGGKDRIKVLAELTRIRQICCDPSLLFEDYKGESAKRSAVMELIQSAIDGGHRMLLFSQFTSMLDLLMADLDREQIPYYLITGATPKEKRLSLVHDFNEGDVPVFLISLKAGGTGLNLTGADMVIHYDPWWNLAVQNQATDRAHRIGQTRQVTVYKLVLKDTIEERIVELQEMKKDLAEAILAGESESITQLSNEELLALLE